MISSAAQRRLVRAAGLAAVAFFLWLVGRFWHPVYGFTAFIQLSRAREKLAIADLRGQPISVSPGEAGYDGLYYAQLAFDPTLRHPDFPRAMDNFAYRARRILPPALAWLLAAGRPAWIVQVYSLLNVGAWLVLAWLLWRLLAVENFRGWLAWAGVLFSAGALASVRLSLSDLIALTILAGAMLAVERGKTGLASGVLATAALARETSVAAAVALIERPWFSWKNVARGLVVIAPLAAWLAYVRFRAGAADQGWSNFAMPVAGLIEKWHADLVSLHTVGDQPLAWTTLLATLGLTVQAAFVLTRWRPDDRWWRLGAAFAAMLLCLGTAVWEGYPGAATRVLLPLTLAFNVRAHRARAPLAWLLAGNLTVFAGLLALRDVPHDPRELAAVRSHGVAAIADIGDGWFGLEHHGSKWWAWATRHGDVTIEAWPKHAASLDLEFSLRSMAPGSVVIMQGGREVARFRVGEKLEPHRVTIALGGDGRTRLDFASDAPPKPESPDPGARALGFALYDLRMAVAEK